MGGVDGLVVVQDMAGRDEGPIELGEDGVFVERHFGVGER